MPREVGTSGDVPTMVLADAVAGRATQNREVEPTIPFQPLEPQGVRGWAGRDLRPSGGSPGVGTPSGHHPPRRVGVPRGSTAYPKMGPTPVARTLRSTPLCQATLVGATVGQAVLTCIRPAVKLVEPTSTLGSGGQAPYGDTPVDGRR